MPERYRQLISSISWNLLLIVAGSLVYAIGVKSIAVPRGFITGGITGVALLSYYFTGALTTGIWYFIINIPLFLVSLKMVSRRFFAYSVFGMIISALWFDLITFTVPLEDPFLSMLAGGTLIGAGAGIVFHSLGSLGGNDVIAIVLHQRFNLRMGTYFFGFNLALFAFSFGVLDTETVLYSIAMSYISSQVIDRVLNLFNQRKMALIISEHPDAVAADIHRRLHRGATFLNGTGTYTGKARKIILTVVHNYQLKRLEESVFSRDPDAFVITENTFNVLGRGFSKRKIY